VNKHHVFLVLSILWVLFGVWSTYFNISRDAGFAIGAGVVMICFGVYLSFLNYGKLKTNNNGHKFIDEFAEMQQIYREYYGDGSKKPNGHCFQGWLGPTYGWVETDEHFKKRISKKMEAERD